jgi:hypothetical protein
MEAFIVAKYTAQDLVILNQCCTHLKAVTLADIITGNGCKLLPGIVDGTRKAMQHHSYEWQCQPDEFGVAHWRLWQQAMAKCFLCHPDDAKLAAPLGEWSATAATHWQWMVNVRQGQMFQ